MQKAGYASPTTVDLPTTGYINGNMDEEGTRINCEI
jgi:hypothetical protein